MEDRPQTNHHEENTVKTLATTESLPGVLRSQNPKRRAFPLPRRGSCRRLHKPQEQIGASCSVLYQSKHWTELALHRHGTSSPVRARFFEDGEKINAATSGATSALMEGLHLEHLAATAKCQSFSCRKDYQRQRAAKALSWGCAHEVPIVEALLGFHLLYQL